MTEEEARKKWCPMVQWTSLEWNNNAIDNRGFTLDENRQQNCIASECMMWKWIQITKVFDADTKPLDPGWHKVGATPMSEGYRIIWLKEPDEKTQGYCGLAGRSE